MRVHGTGLVGIDAFQIQASAGGKGKAEEAARPRQTKNEYLQPPIPPAADSSSAPAETTEEKGVIRLLMEGHFKGVADVRLRINFHDELVALDRQNLQASAEDTASRLRESIAGSFDSFMAGTLLPEETAVELNAIRDAFFQGIESTSNDLLPAPGATLGSFRAALTSGFETMLSALGSVLALEPTTGESPDGSASVAGVTEERALPGEAAGEENSGATEPDPTLVPDPAAAAFLEELRTLFAAEMEDLAARADGRLPELSEPKGNGSAYAKFLAIYNQLRGINGPDGESSGAGSVETRA